MTIGVDFDGTCVKHAYPEIGEDIGAVPVLKELIENGHQLILVTMRPTGGKVEEAMKWFEDRGIELYGVNGDPDQESWTDSPKPYCQLYIDDAGLGCPIKSDDPRERHYVDWRRTRQLLITRGLIAVKTVF